MKQRAVVCVGSGGWYPQGADRLKQSLIETGFTGQIYLWKDTPPRAIYHDQDPFAFKAAAMREAQAGGAQQVIWADSSHWAIRPIDPIFDYMDREGHYMIEDTSWNCGQWCTDAALAPLGITREEAFNIPMTWAGLIGVDFTNERSVKWFNEWERLSLDGVTFHGSKYPGPNVSADPRVLGHRHDQTAQAVLCHKLQMKLEPLHKCLMQVDSWTERPEVVMLARGGIKGVHWQ